MTHLSRGAVSIVGHDFNDDRHVAGAVAFVNDLFIVDGVTFARGLFDGAGDVIVGHVVCFCLCDHIAQLIVVDRVCAALFNRNCNLSADLREDFAALGVGFLFFILNIRPFGMS
ncbi:hypothetical protein SDC9_159922 [bioreactor metagenome]|uniref:Uncharacterized protein n=1 Tax=bioreactor metagenome TaxID=1076179 RepID=A0A645FJJ1_9ZZZZ